MLALLLLLQGGSPTLSPRVAAMLPGLPAPVQTDVSITTRFSTDTVYTGEQVELVTATWFSRDLLVLLRRQPSLRAPTLSGLWSTQAVSFPALTLSRVVNNRVMDLYITHQTLFPLGASTIAAPPAELTYAVPVSTSFFAPEERRVLRSQPARLVVLPIPAHLVGALGTGPTARGLSLTWRGPAAGIVAGTPAPIELVIRGTGNVTLWPNPEITWSDGVHVYPETTQEQTTQTNGLVSGEKRFRFTVVVDSQGVLSLPAVRYPFFDPGRREVLVAAAPATALPVLMGNGASMRARLPLATSYQMPWATRVMQTLGWWTALIASLPLLLLFGRRWRVRAPAPVIAPEDPAFSLRRILAAVPERVVTTLRRRGVARTDAEEVAEWLTAVERHRFGPSGSPDPGTPTSLLQRVLHRVRRAGWAGLLLFGLLGPAAAQQPGAQAYLTDDAVTALHAFTSAAQQDPLRPGRWQDLGAAAWRVGDEAGAAAAWLRGLALAPRDPALRQAWQSAGAMPAPIRQLAPSIPLSRDELAVATLALWLVAGLLWWRRARGSAVVLLSLALLSGSVIGFRTWRALRPEVLLRATALRISPAPNAPVLGEVPAWSRPLVERRVGTWYLVRFDRGMGGWVPGTAVAELGRMPPAEPMY